MRSVCRICGDLAKFKNYGALSCHSCKTFFRRNAPHPELVRPCYYSGNCRMNIDSRRACTSCRLKKCFLIGMRAQLIRKEDQSTTKFLLSVEAKKSLILKYRRSMQQLPSLYSSEDTDPTGFNNAHWKPFYDAVYAFDHFSLIPSMQNTLQSLSFSHDRCFYPRDELNMIGSVYEFIWQLVRSVPDFQIFEVNDQQSLLQRNLHGVSCFAANIFYRGSRFLKTGQSLNSFGKIYGWNIAHETDYFLNQLHSDATMLKLMVVILTFSSNCFIVDVHEDMWNDGFLSGAYRLFGSQNAYAELLWKHLIYEYSYCEVIQRFSRVVKCVCDQISQLSNIYENNLMYQNVIDDKMKEINKQLVVNQNEFIPLWGKTLLCC